MLSTSGNSSSSSGLNVPAAERQFSPLVYWAQSKDQIFLKIDLNEVKKPNFIVRDAGKLVQFGAIGLGAHSCQNRYEFSLNLYAEVGDLNFECKVHDSKVDVTLIKCQAEWWPRLTAQPQKPHWLKIDFDRWTSEDDQDIETPLATSIDEARDIMQDYPGMYEKLQKEEYGYIRENGKKVYLAFYNLLQFIGYLYVICVIGVLYYRDGVKSISQTYETVGGALKFCQLLQYLEVMHPMFGYTKGSVMLPFFQITGRNFILFAMIQAESRMHSKPVVFYLFIVWSLIEVVRYPYYITTIFKRDISLLTWLRYTIWIPLYPMGILCESIVLLRNIPYFEETQRFTITMPNSWNFTFSMTIFMKIYLLLLTFPGTYLLLTHMAKLRAKKLQKSSKDVAAERIRAKKIKEKKRD